MPSVADKKQLAGLEAEELDEQHRALYTSAGQKEEPPLASIPEVSSSQVKGLSLESIKKSLQSLVDPGAMPNRKAFGQDDEAFRVARQKVLEEDALTSAQERWRKDHDELVARGAAPIGNSVNILLWNWHQALVPLIKQELQRVTEAEENPTYQSAIDRCLYGPFLRLMTPEKVAAIVILEMVRMQNTQLAGEGTKSAHAVMAVGSILQQEYYAQELSKKKNQDIFGFLEKDGLKELFNDRIQFRNRVMKAKQKMAEMGDTSSVMLEWPASVKAKLGAVLISMLLHCAKVPVTKTDPSTGEKITQHQPAVQHAYEYVKGRRLGVLRLHPDVVQKLGTEPLRGSALGRNLPMLVPPLPWLSWNDGGYYYTRSRVVRTKSSKEQNIYVQAASNRGDLDQLFQGLDVLGQTAWRINKPVFDVILQVWNEGKQFASIPPREMDLQIPPEPPQSADPKIRSNWLKEVREIRTEEKNNHSQRCTINLKLEIARAVSHALP
jgi:DNA-directed RNA polymerase